MPPTPRAASKLMEPVEMTAIGSSASFDPSRTIDPFPNCFSICARASSTALVRSSVIAMGDSPVGAHRSRFLLTSAGKRRGGMEFIPKGLLPNLLRFGPMIGDCQGGFSCRCSPEPVLAYLGGEAARRHGIHSEGIVAG